MNILFNNTYAELPNHFFQKIHPAKLAQPRLLHWNSELAKQLGLSASYLSEGELAQIFSGQKILENSTPIATAYAGHQFGNFVPQLGDGRAILLGEVLNPEGKRYDIQLKGAGQTVFSRSGDGRSALGPVIREYIVSEAMYHLGVPTTRSLAAVSTGELVYREQPMPGGILTRVAASHIRIGHFEFFAARRDIEGLKSLTDYAIKRHYPDLANSKDKYVLFFQKVIQAQAALIAHWMDIGFIHGVMNTDNMLISGETIDFGPCAFMDTFNYNQVFSSIDRNSRYAYNNQGHIAEWNLSRLADCLLLLENADQDTIIKIYENEIERFNPLFEAQWLKRMRAKLGLFNELPEDNKILKNWLDYLQKEKLDYTLSYRNLSNLVDGENSTYEFKASSLFKNFKEQWQQRLKLQPLALGEIKNKMNLVNPVYIPRNHQVERAIQGVLNEDLKVFKEMIQVLKNPFQEQLGFEIYKLTPRPEEQVTKTFCGT